VSVGLINENAGRNALDWWIFVALCGQTLLNLVSNSSCLKTHICFYTDLEEVSWLHIGVGGKEKK